MGKLRVEIDAEGKLQLPEEARKELGDKVTLRKTPKGYLLSSKQYATIEELRKVITSKHKRTDKPKLATPKEMKSIWEASS
ncbi:MAG: hypothetical protein ACFCUE_05960 [Candidatus Bathyarchaeia archaeon]|jgi:DNA-binding transcriptional regulator/RsmH inhibitor MraZ